MCSGPRRPSSGPLVQSTWCTSPSMTSPATSSWAPGCTTAPRWALIPRSGFRNLCIYFLSLAPVVEAPPSSGNWFKISTQDSTQQFICSDVGNFLETCFRGFKCKSKKPGDGCNFLFFSGWDFLYLLILCKEDWEVTLFWIMIKGKKSPQFLFLRITIKRNVYYTYVRSCIYF